MPLELPQHIIYQLLGYGEISSDHLEIYYLASSFDQLVVDVETLLDREIDSLQESLKRIPKPSLADYSLRDTSQFDGIIGDLDWLNNYVANELRKALFTSIYSLVEPAFDIRIRFIKERDNLQLSLGDIKGQGIEKAKIYLTKLANIHVPHLEWEQMMNLNKLRNCIVHGQGRLPNCKYQPHLRNYVSRQQHLSLDKNDGIVFHKGFCEEALVIISHFFLSLDQYSSPGWCEVHQTTDI